MSAAGLDGLRKKKVHINCGRMRSPNGCARAEAGTESRFLRMGRRLVRKEKDARSAEPTAAA
jgi:hypothetical protein